MNGKFAYDMRKIANDFSSEAKQNHSSIHQMDNRSRKRFAFEINRFCSCNANYTNNFSFPLCFILFPCAHCSHTKIHWTLCGWPNFHWAIENFRKVNKQWKHLHTLIEREPSNGGGHTKRQRHNEASHIDCNFIFIAATAAKKEWKFHLVGVRTYSRTVMYTVKRQFNDERRRKSSLFLFVAMRSSEFQNELVYSDSTPEANMSIIPHIRTKKERKVQPKKTSKAIWLNCSRKIKWIKFWWRYSRHHAQHKSLSLSYSIQCCGCR